MLLLNSPKLKSTRRVKTRVRDAERRISVVRSTRLPDTAKASWEEPLIFDLAGSRSDKYTLPSRKLSRKKSMSMLRRLGRPRLLCLVVQMTRSTRRG